MAKTWFITGASSGLGRDGPWALERGDRVAVAARRAELFQELSHAYGDAVLPIELDVRDREPGFAAVAAAHRHLGQLDVVVNAAGYGHYGAVEEVTEEEARAIMDTNFFGALWITQAALPFLRAQGGGHILQVSSVGGLVAGSSLGVYHASKWALEGMSTSLAAEVARWGIKVTIVEPTGYSTDAEGSSRRSTPHPDYDWLLEVRAERRALVASREGDPRATPAVILKLVDADDPRCGSCSATAPPDRGARVRGALASWRVWEAASRWHTGGHFRRHDRPARKGRRRLRRGSNRTVDWYRLGHMTGRIASIRMFWHDPMPVAEAAGLAARG